jgi:TRAP-type C4-dicarboxylate transport system substrate-binding protein
MQTGACDAGITSSTSLISFRLEELSKHLTTGRGKSYWFMLEPLVISKEIWTSLTPAQQKVVDEVGADLEKFGTDGAKADDQEVARVYEKAGAKVHDMDAAVVEKWTKIARETAWKDFADKGEEYARLLKLAESVPAS